MNDQVRQVEGVGQMAWASKLARTTLLLIAGNLLLIASAKVQVPFWPVPMTLETMAVLFVAATYGRQLAVTTIALFLAEGAAGLPVFATGGGLVYFMGPTAGYLFGYLGAAAVVAFLADRGWRQGYFRMVAAMLLGELVIMGCGSAWLATLVGYHDAVVQGVLPFVLGDLTKIALAATTITLGRQVMRQYGTRRP